MTIELPEWARIDTIVMIKDTECIRGDDPNHWYQEHIISFGYDGVFHQDYACPVYYTKFDAYGKTILTRDDYHARKAGKSNGK